MGRYNRNNKFREKQGTNPRLSILTFNISDELLDMLAFGKARGWWCSRSEGIRVALGRSLPIIMKEYEAMNLKIVENLQFQGELDPDKEYVKIPGRGYIEIVGEA